MGMSLFGQNAAPNGATIEVPTGFATHLRWIPRLGDIFPNFSIPYGDGEFHFHDWAEGSWVYFFSHPQAETPVCSTEIADVAAHGDELARRGAKALNISTDSAEVQQAWIAEIERIFGVTVDFPLLSDPEGRVVSVCDMVHPHEDALLCVRKGFIIDPSLRIRMIFEYPLNVGRDFEEVLRVIDALRATDHNDLVAPGGWMPGDPLMVSPALGTAAARDRFGARLRVLNPYMRLLQPPQTR
ncbi:MAG: redoxin domain-containing protein [Phaeovulum sp.]|jgi:alkyl hydroperoxide reductase subunit AhpC|uniref:redoxin domain-containing protein n=1 Tax=Phaeovulum sp. TaxID=2934796 RepID=UPI00273394D5|nr:redoxin domain-containing protein [Phaeovulum sp.]MDP3860072.1 redoxin domain-containing protein [Phaeovulum sp.]